MFYFDHNSTTPVDAEVAAVVAKAMAETYGNPSSVHRAGQLARQQLEAARRTVAGFLGASAAEITFTSGGTESNNLAIFGVVRAACGIRHVITTAVEHPSVLEPCRQLEREGVLVSYAPVDDYGRARADEIERLMRPETVLVSVMHGNNESGAVQPVSEIASIVRARRALGRPVYFHCDGVQAAGKIPLNLHESGIDLYSVSGHKLYAPKGCGVLYVRKNTPLESMQMGGRHERGRRAGTENVPGAMAMARAMELCSDADCEAVRGVRDAFEAMLRENVADVRINGSGGPRLMNTSNVLFHGVAAEALVIALDMRGMAVSTGSACSSGSVEPSHVLLAMGLSEEEAKSSVRFSFGRGNSVEDVKELVAVLVKVLAKMRKPVLVG